MLEESKKKKKQLSRQEQLRQFWANYPVVINPEMVGPNGVKSSEDWSGVPNFPQYTQESLSSRIISKARDESVKKCISESIDLVEYDQMNDNLRELLSEHSYKIINEKSLKPFSISSSLDLKQKQAAYNLIALSAMSALIASRVLTDKAFLKRNISLQDRFRDALNRAVNVAATDPGILSKIKQNASGMKLVTMEEIQVMESFKNPNFKSKNTGLPLSLLKSVYEQAVKNYKNGVQATKVY